MRTEWARHPPRLRSEILHRGFQALTDRSEELALLMTLEMGKALPESRGEVAYAAEFLRWFAEETVRIGGDYAVTPDGVGRMLVMHQPVGPSLLITPWNFPLAMGARKVAPALAAGCTIVWKPAPQTPLSALALTGILEEAGLPPGVLNVVTTSDASGTVGPLFDDPRLRKMSFTGSTAVGRHLLAEASTHVLRVSLELGGNAPFIVFEDADLDEAVDGAMVAKMRNIGEACTAANRFLVADQVADEFTDRLAERMSAQRVGRGTEEGVDLGPLVEHAAREKVHGLVTDARHRGAGVVTGGEPIDGPGYFYPPTVLADVPPDARVAREEIFGPVAPVTRFSDDEEAVSLANGTEFGLVAYVYTQGVKRALRVSEALETGMVGLNRGMVSNPAAPFGGVKESGLGREGGRVGIDEFLETKYVAVGL